MTTPWQPTGDELVDSIRRASTRRRADCLGFLDEFFEMYVADHTDAEFEASWVRIVQEYPWYAEDVFELPDERDQRTAWFGTGPALDRRVE